MNEKHKRWTGFAVAGLVALAVLIIVLWPSGVEVDYDTVNRGTLEVTVEEQGRTRARYRYTVAAPVSGRLLRTSVEEGDRVTAGEELTSIAPPPENSRSATTLKAQLASAEARQQEAQAALTEAKSNLAVALGDAMRRDELFKKGLVSVEERDHFAKTADAAQARVESARASLSAAMASVNEARARLIGIDNESTASELTTVVAPVEGTVLRVHEESERVVAAGTPLFELGKGNELEIIIDFLTQDAVKINPGDTIRIDGWGGSDTLLGTVRYKEPRAFTKISTLGVEEQRVNVIGDFVDPPASLGAEFRVEAAVVVWSGSNILRIPTTAIFRRNGMWHAFVVRSGRARLQSIEIGQRGSDYAEVTDGIEDGDTIVLFPSELVKDGVKVILKR